MRTRWSAYAGVSVALAGGVIVKALAQRPNVYSAAVYLSQSSANLMILTNFLFIAACTILLGLQKLLYGPLRPIEIEQLYEKAWFAVTETCLAMTIFRGEIGAWFLVMFFALLAGKVWAWIGEGRVEILEQQPPRNPRLFHTRLALSLSLSVFFDLTMLEYVVKQVMRMARPDMMVMFGFEFAVLSIVSLSTAARYAIDLVEIAIVRKQKARKIDEIQRDRIAAAVREVNQSAQQQTGTTNSMHTSDASAPPSTAIPLQALEAARRAIQQPVDEQDLEVEGWEAKGRWIFYLDLTTDFFKLVVYLSFFFILLIFYGLPIHILRDVFMTFRSFFKRIGDFIRYRTATRDMNARYPDATEQEIGSDDVCIICREEMRPYQPPANGERTTPVAERMRPKKLPCGHILHFSCLRSWLERQQICPTCRTNVVSRTTNRTTPNNTPADGAAGQHDNAPPAERPGPRIYQWGPLRIGIGAARGNMFEDLQRGLGDGQARPVQQAAAEGPQQYGFGIRWDGLRRRDRNDRGERNQRSITRQLEDVQRQISQEYRALGQMTNELRLLRNMEAELARLRAQRQGPISTTSTQPQLQPTTSMPQVMALAGNSQQVLQAGNGQLPAGLTLPEGWSMMPLHPANPTQPAFLGNIVPPLPGPFPGPLSAHFGPPSMIPTAGDPAAHLHLNTAPLQQHTHNNHLFNWDHENLTNGVHPQPIPPHTNSPSLQPNMPNGVAATLNHHGRVAEHLRQNQQNSASAETATIRPPAMSSRSSEMAPSTQVAASPDLRYVSSRIAPGAAGVAGHDNNTSSRSVTNSPDEPPVSSMFTLPTWGSTAMQASTSNRAVNDQGQYNPERSPYGGTSRAEAASSNQAQDERSSSSSKGRSKNPTVDDLVEDPD